MITFSLYSDSKVQYVPDAQNKKLLAEINAYKSYIEALKRKYEVQKNQQLLKHNSDKELLKNLLNASLVFIVILFLIILFLCMKLKSIDEREQKG